MFKSKRNCLIFSLLFSTIFFASILQAGQVNAEVKLILERLPLEKQNQLQDLSDKISSYLNEQDWLDEDIGASIDIMVQIYLQDASVGSEDRYKGTFLISNGVDIQYYDKYWKFPYEQGQQLVHQEGIFDPFTGFLDFYMYLVLGGELDKYGPLYGSSMYDKARTISEQSLFNVQFSSGWKERRELMATFYEKDFTAFRKMKDTYFLGYSYIQENRDKARQTMRDAIRQLDDILRKNPEHREAINFLKAHHIEIIDVFKSDPDVMQMMADMDPERANTYKKYLR